MKVFVVNNGTNELPEYANPGDSGLDLRANFSNGVNMDFLDGELRGEDKLTIYPKGRALIPTGLKIAIPEGYEVQIRSRSGLALKSKIFVLNSPGTVDFGYRGEIGVIIFNAGTESFEISQGDRIAQAVLVPVSKIDWELCETLPESVRSDGGFGSTGKK